MLLRLCKENIGKFDKDLVLLYHRICGEYVWKSVSKECKSAEIVEQKLCMELEHEGDEWNIVPNNSTSVYLIVLQGIAIELAKQLGITLEDFKVNHPGGGIGAKLRGEQLWN